MPDTPRTPAALAQLTGAAALAIALTWPMPMHPLSSVLGLPQTTAPCHLWVLWWAGRHLDQLDSTLLFYPYGGDVLRLYGSDVLSPLLLAWMPLPPALLYNGWVLLLLVTGGIGAARLAARTGARPGGTWIALAIFEAAPFFQHELLNGTVELLGAAFLPWFAAALLDLLDHPTAGTGARAGGWALAAAFCSIYNLFFLALIGSILLLHRATTTTDPVLGGARLRALLLAAAIGGTGLGALGAVHLSHGARETLTSRETALEQEPPAPDAYADLTDWLDPSTAAIPALVALPHGETFEYWTTATVHLGFVAVGLGLFGMLKGMGSRAAPHRAPSAGVWVLIFAAGFLIASGPWLRVGGTMLQVAGGPVPLPSLTLSAMVPAFSVTAPHTYRYASVVVLALAVLAARAVHRGPVGVGLAALVVIESLFASPLPRPAAVTRLYDSPVLHALAEMPDGAVLTAPTEADDLYDLGRAMLAQTVHGKPFQDGGMHHRAGANSVALFGENPLVEALAHRGARTLPEPAASVRWLGDLAGTGYRYLLVAVEDDDVLTWANTTLGAPEREDEVWALWRLDAMATPGGLEQP